MPNLILQALEDAARTIANDASNAIEPVVDRDTQNVPGAPDIGATILSKIDAAAVFVADVTIVGHTNSGKPTPNPNVLVGSDLVGAVPVTSAAVVQRLQWSRAEIMRMKWQLRSSFRAISMGAALVSALFAPVACSSTGEAGHSCTPAGFLSGGETCDHGLVCNEGESTPTCEEPNTHFVGEPCGADDNGKTGLWCNHEVCSEALGPGEPCPSGFGCGTGLQCIKAVAPICAAVDAAAPDASAE